MRLLTSRKKFLKRSLWLLAIVFILMNVMAFFHSYKFTHFSTKEISRTKDPAALSVQEKLMTLAFGVDNPRPTNKIFPSHTYETVNIKSNKTIECWSIKRAGAKGTVVLFHGFSGKKSLMLDRADAFLKLGYNTLLVDFMGSGGSEGDQTTIGFFEAEQVKSSFDYLVSKGEKNIFLSGTSMGSVAIMKAVNDYQLSPAGIMIECPFGSMYKTVCARFKMMGAPSFPMAGLLVFWGGVQNNFWAFGHNPTEYAKGISCPTLLLYGAKDAKVSRAEIDEIYTNLKGNKELKVYEEAGHEDLFSANQNGWTKDIETFMTR